MNQLKINFTDLNRVLIVDDDTDFSESLSEILELENYLIETANSRISALEISQSFKPHMAILDIKIGQDNGVDLISDLRDIVPDILCIILTGYADITSVINALRKSAFDYLTKPIHPEELLLKLEYGFEKINLEKQQHATANVLKSSEKRYRTIINNMLDGVIILDKNGIIISLNNAAETIFGYNTSNLEGSNINQLISINFNDKKNLTEYITLSKHQSADYETFAYRANNDKFPLRFSISELPLGNENQKQFIFSCFDILAQKNQEKQLRKNLKMDALGKLSSGIAHDYNNMLGIISGYAELLKNEIGDQHHLAKYAHEILYASERSIKLTKKLLNFSRKKTFEAENINLNTLLKKQKHMLEKMLTLRIDLKFDLQHNLWKVWLDSSDMEDAILNMSINAMHAMDKHGELTFKTKNQKISSDDALPLNIEPGEYVSLSIIDTGCGMDKATEEKIFDPFYTTKGSNGTGLGLSQVYGFITRSHGAIKVKSDLNVGTEFVFYFPRYIQNECEQKLTNEILLDNLKGSENILVVDDEPALLALNCKRLSQQGYHVFSAENGLQALKVLKQHSIDLLYTDIIMPEMNGYELALFVQKEYPAIKIQLNSGYEKDRSENLVDDDLRKNILYKPVSTPVLLKKIRELLDKT